jgi:drug/metabolite transporter (DMT)-like permease
MSGDTVLGVLAAAGAAACYDGAVVLQAHDAREVAPEHGLRLSLLRRLVVRRRWLAGTALAVLGVPLHLAAFALAPVTVVQPTLALGMLLLLAGGAWLLDERVGPREWVAAVAVIAGVVLLTLGAPPETSEVPLPSRVAITGAVLAAGVALPFVVGARRAGAWILILGAGCAFSLSAVAAKLLVTEVSADRPGVVLAALVVAGAASGLGLLIDMTALQRYEATRVAPPMFVLETAIPVALAPWLFGEAWRGTFAADLAVAAGLALVLAGGGLLGASRTVAGLEGGGPTLGEGDDQRAGRRPPAVREVGPAR